MNCLAEIVVVLLLSVCGALTFNSQYSENQDEAVEVVLLAESEPMQVTLLYETLCEPCRQFDSTQFKLVIEKLHTYVDFLTYPYGNARQKNINNKTVVVCQNGLEECYGNMVHGCALHMIANKTEAQLLNSCMMDTKYDDYSIDDAADACGRRMNIAVDEIKKCAGSDKGKQLLMYYGKKSKQFSYDYVPFIAINGKEWQYWVDEETIMTAVCAAYKNPPEPCKAGNIFP